MHQPILGAAIPLLMALLIYLVLRCRAPIALLILTPLVMAAGAVWAVIPDIPRLLGLHDLYSLLAKSPWTDIFCWHYSIDQIEAAHLDAMTPLFNACFASLLALLLLVAWRELHRAEHPRTSQRASRVPHP